MHTKKNPGGLTRTEGPNSWAPWRKNGTAQHACDLVYDRTTALSSFYCFRRQVNWQSLVSVTKKLS